MSKETESHLSVSKVLRETFRWLVILPTIVVAAVLTPLLIAAVTIVGTPFAVVFFLGLCPFATIRWAFVGDETWWESWKVCMRSIGE